jgi:putative flavoprotein involved in K+ transport
VERFEVVVIGGGQAGLAAGYHLARRGLPFVILERATRLGDSWRGRYDSLRLFTPARYDGLPGLAFPAPADHYPGKDEVADYLEAYAGRFQLPVRLGVGVTRLHQTVGGHRLETSQGVIEARQVVVATGPFQRPHTPPFAARLDPSVAQLHSSAYLNPAQIPQGPVLVVGAGNSGAQIAEELLRTHRVYLAVGQRQPQLPRRVLGRSLFWWFERLGLDRASRDSWLGRRMRRRDPLIGASLGDLERGGATLVARAAGAEGRRVALEGGAALEPGAVVWATGFRPDYGWLEVSVLDGKGQPRHRRGVTAAPGLYFVGLSWQHTRGSALLGWVGRDAAFVAGEVERAARGQGGRTEPTRAAGRGSA